MNEAPKKAVAYVRISSIRQIDNESPVTQRDTIQRYADTNNIEIVQWFEDIAKSGKNADRDGLQDLMKYCLKHKGKVDYWIVYNMKRASRDIDTYSSEVRIVLKARGVSVRSATEPAVNDTKEGRFMENLLVLLGQLDNEGKAEVTIDNMRSLALQGYWQHPPIVGYETDKIENDIGKPRPTLKPSKMANNVKQVLERYSLGDITKAELARYAKEVGLRSRYDKVLSEDSIFRLIKSPTYAGYISDKFTNYELVKGKHPAIISTETYEVNQRLLYARNSRKGEVHTVKNEDYPLRGFLLCSNCHKPLYASAPTSGSGKRSPRYHCARKRCVGKVTSVKSNVVHDDFIKLLERIKPNEGILRLYRTVMIREANNNLDNLNIRIGALRQQLDKVSKTRSSTIEKFVEGKITQNEKDDLTNNLEEQKLATCVELQKLEKQQTVREGDIEQAINFMNSVDKQWEFSDVDIRQKFQSMIFPRGLIYDAKMRKFGTSEISELYRCIPNKKAVKTALKSDLVAGVGFEPTTLWL